MARSSLCKSCGYAMPPTGQCSECGRWRFTTLRECRARLRRREAVALISLGSLAVVVAALLALAPSLSAAVWSVFYGSQANQVLSLTRYVVCLVAPIASAVLLYLGIVRFAIASSPPSHTWRAGRTQLGTAAGCTLWCVTSGLILYALLALVGFAG